MKKIPLFLMLAFGCWTFQACNNTAKKEDSAEVAEDANEDKAGVDDDDSEFAITAASGGMMEVELGRMAQEKGQSQQVKDFGAMMVQDHSKANDELKALAAAKNITLPGTLSDKHQKHVDDLSKLSGAEFDKEYVKLMVNDHKEDIDEFEEAAKEDQDADLKAFAAKTLPTLKAHHAKIKAIQDAM
ncbi:DUF4142 domain-containing protein [Tellurirhabdus bombi]|uniref:DUF4142 domain-containing protein n=1 Tax=Tellurirhabdus bombi TaxID=2907205 RepID=UPI001F3FFE6F|nr:DUF4142 domain-containing protein [Tellurirhabdus bombi]